MKNKGLWIGVTLAIVALVILFFVLRKPTYQVAFSSDGSTILETQNIRKNKMAEKPNDPTKEGYVFAGWYLNGERFDFNQEITEDITLVARWTKVNAIMFTIKFDTNGGNKIDNIEVEKNSIIGKLPTPVKKGYAFKGWYFGTSKVDKNTIVTRDMTLVAKWEKETTTTKKTTTKKTTTTTSTTTKPVVTTNTTTTKKPTTSTTTTKPITTTKKVDKIGVVIDKKDSVVGQITIYLTKNGEIVSGTCDITTIDGVISDVKIGESGFAISSKILNNEEELEKNITNIKIK